MQSTHIDIFIAEIIEEKPLSLGQLCRSCGVPAEQVIEHIEYGIIEPAFQQSNTLYFDSQNMTRVRQPLRLKNDLEINLPGIALGLELLDEVMTLRKRLTSYEK